MLAGIPGRLVTGPVAFFVAWAIDAAVLSVRLVAARSWRRDPE